MLLSFLFLGWGAATLLATANSWLVNLVNGTLIVSFMQGFYGVRTPVTLKTEPWLMYHRLAVS